MKHINRINPFCTLSSAAAAQINFGFEDYYLAPCQAERPLLRSKFNWELPRCLFNAATTIASHTVAALNREFSAKTDKRKYFL